MPIVASLADRSRLFFLVRVPVARHLTASPSVAHNLCRDHNLGKMKWYGAYWEDKGLIGKMPRFPGTVVIDLDGNRLGF